MSRLAEIDERMESIRSELLELADSDLDEEQAARFDELETEYRSLEEEREPLARRAETVDRVRSTVARSRRDGGRGLESGGSDVGVSTRSDPYDDLERVRSGVVPAEDLRARALTAVEQAPGHLDDGGRQRATALLERNDRHGRIARHVLLTGSDAYQRAFEQILTGTPAWALAGEERDALSNAMSLRAINEGTDSAGGFLVPFHLDPTIVLSNAGSTNPFRQISRTETISTNEWHGVSSAGVTAAWAAEAAEATDNSPTFAQPAVTIHKAHAWVQASFESTQDTNIASQVGMLLNDARDNLEAAAFAVGTGTGQPTGVVTALTGTGSEVAAATADTYAVEDVYALKDALPARFRPNGTWVAEQSIYSLTRQFATGSGPQHAFWTDLGADVPSLLLGRPAVESSAMDSSVDATADNYILVYGDFRHYLVVDRIGMSVQFEPLVKGANQRPTGEVGWYAHWRVGANVLVENAFRLLNA